MMVDKQTSKLIREARKWEGWRVEETKSGWMLYPPDKAYSGVLVHKTPSDHRTRQNIISLLRQRGAPV